MRAAKVTRERRRISYNNEQAKQNIMKAVIRKYSGKGAKELIDILEQRAAGLDSVMGSVKGLVTYTLVRSGDGGLLGELSARIKPGWTRAHRMRKIGSRRTPLTLVSLNRK